MSKVRKIAFYMLAFLFLVYLFMKYSGMCVIYSIPTTGNEPNLKSGSFLLVSNLMTPKRGDFISYNFNNPEFEKATWMHRLCGMENDTIQLIEGTLFVNGKNVDEQYNLQHSYLLNEKEFNALHTDHIEHFFINTEQGSKGYLTFIEDVDAKTHKLTAKRYRNLRTIPDTQISKIYGNPWNKDHFGPVVIPKGKLFVLGDNRDNSMDSRFFGFIDETDVTGVLWKKLFTMH